jgi:hypothetical protein
LISADAAFWDRLTVLPVGVSFLDGVGRKQGRQDISNVTNFLASRQPLFSPHGWTLRVFVGKFCGSVAMACDT